MNQILTPGEYFIELEFDRLVAPAVLHKALTSMGFGVVVFDQSLPAINVGASAPLRTVNVTSTRAPVTVQSRYRAPMTSTIARAATVIKVADGGPPAALRPSTAVSSRTPGGLSLNTPVTAVYKPVNTAIQNHLPPPPPPSSPSGAPTGNRFSSMTASTFDPKAGVASPDGGAGQAPAPSDGGGGGGGGGGTSADDGSPDPTSDGGGAPVTDDGGGNSADVPMPPPDDPTSPSPTGSPSLDGGDVTFAVIQDRWKRWKEWGSPFALGPGGEGTTTSGTTDSDSDPLRFRVLARLDQPIMLTDKPGMRWLFVKQLSFSFLGDLNFQSNPFTLRHGALYEVRFLSRAKSNPNRESVKKGLVDMGFAPIKLSAIKRNITLPRRAASLTLWYGIGMWTHADSVIINDDPFFFETVMEIPSS